MQNYHNSFFLADKGIKNTFIKAVVWILKISVVAAACFFIYQRVLINHSITDLQGQYEKLIAVVPFFILLSVVLLSMLNWGLETCKWKYSLRKHEPISFKKALESVLCGIAVSIAAPNRTGEFAGRIVHMEKISKTQAAFLTFPGSYSQFLVTLMAGSLGLVGVFIFYPHLLPQAITGYLYLIIIFTLLLCAAFFMLHKSSMLFRHKKIKSWLQVFDNFNPKELGILLALSFIRYIVFSLQFYLLLTICGVQIPFLMAMMLIAVTYFIMTFIPTTIISELAVRGSVSVAVFGLFTADSLAIVNAGFLLWTINLMFPALLGCVFLIKARIVKSPAIL